MKCNEAIIQALRELGGEASIQEVKELVERNHPNTWKDISTVMADMVPVSRGGNGSSLLREDTRVLVRVARGRYRFLP